MTMSQFEKEFLHAADQPTGLWSRWWFTKGDQSYDAIYNDMKNSITDAGIVRIEVAKGLIWTDSQENMNAFYYLLKAAGELGLKLDIATGTPYPAENGVKPLVVNGKTYYDPADVGYSPESCNSYALTYAIAEVPAEGGSVSLTDQVTAFARKMFFMPAELLPDQTLNIRAECGEGIVGVAALCLAGDGKTILGSCDLTPLADLAPDHAAVDVSPAMLAERSGYAGPGTWRIVSFYTEFQPRNSVCYLNCNATRAWVRWYENYVIDNDAYWTEVLGLPAGEVRRLFRQVVTGVWEDSLEAIPMSYTAHAIAGEDGDLDLFDAFEQFCGYRLPVDYWPALFVNGNSLYNMGTGVAKNADFIRDPIGDQQIRHDFMNTLTRLYRENHLDVYTAWAQAQSPKLDTRVQVAYLYALDQDSAFHSVTIPEYESLNSSDRPDSIRGVAGAAHTSGTDHVSYEMGARAVSFQHETYSMRWYDWLWHSNVGFVHGINATVLHGIEYLYGRTAKVWPGPCMAMPFAALSEPCGQRMPYFKLLPKTVTPYLSRSQYVLHQGRPEMDAAVYYYYNEVLNDYLNYWDDPALAAAGYCYDFIGDTSLALAADSYDAGRQQLMRGGYRALLINQYRAGNQPQCATGPMAKPLPEFEGRGYMPAATAQRILDLAKQGFPVVIVGKAPDKAAAASENGGVQADPAGDAAVQQCFRALLTLPNVMQCATEADAPAALTALGAAPMAAFRGEDTTDLFSFHRKSAAADFYMLFNRTHTIHWKGEERGEELLMVHKDRTIEAEITLHGNGEPYQLDCWSGAVTALPYTRVSADAVQITLSIDPSESVMVAVGKLDGSAPVSCGALQSEMPLTGWSLDLELYRPTEKWMENPAISSDYHADRQDGMTTIVKETLNGIDPVDNGRLLPWPALAALQLNPERASGIGTYRTAFTLPGDFDPARTVVSLRLEQVRELFTVTVNGTEVPFAQTRYEGYEQAITAAVKPGVNTLEIQAASGLWNAAKYYNGLAHEKNAEITPQLDQEPWISPDGISGQVTLRFYAAE